MWIKRGIGSLDLKLFLVCAKIQDLGYLRLVLPNPVLSWRLLE